MVLYSDWRRSKQKDQRTTAWFKIHWPNVSLPLSEETVLSFVLWTGCNTADALHCQLSILGCKCSLRGFCRLAYRAGVTTGITAPKHRGFLGGLSASFSTGVLHRLKRGAVIQDINALHVSVRHFGKVPSVSTQIAALRRQLLHPDESYESDTGRYFREVRSVCCLLLFIHRVQDLTEPSVVGKAHIGGRNR